MIAVPKADVVSELIRRSVQGLFLNIRKGQRSPTTHMNSWERIVSTRSQTIIRYSLLCCAAMDK